MNDLEWPMFSYYVIYYEKSRKGMQHTREGSFYIWASGIGPFETGPLKDFVCEMYVLI